MRDIFFNENEKKGQNACSRTTRVFVRANSRDRKKLPTMKITVCLSTTVRFALKVFKMLKAV